MRRIGVFALVLLFSLCTATGFGQNATTSLRGTIKDPSGAVVPGAKITLENTSAGQELSSTSKNNGEYQLLQILPAKYKITVTAPGFGNQSKIAELLVDQPATIDFMLSVGANNEVVDVTEATQTLNTTDASLGGSADNALIQALPSETRNVPDLLSLQPGVVYLPNTGGNRSGAVNGGRSDQGNVTLDGVDDNDQVYGYAFTGVLRETQDSIEEFRVTTGNADAEAGRSSGAQISLVTKSGTNKFHGAAYEYFRPTNTVANDFFNKQAQVATQQSCFSTATSAATCAGLGNRPPKKIRNIFGGDFGGPILKNKLFFFANYEGSRIAESAIEQRTVPCGVSGSCLGVQAAGTGYANGYLAYAGNSGIDVLSPSDFAEVDADNGCSVCNTTAYPYGPGANPNVEAYLKQLPAANGLSLGDNYNTGSYTFSSPNPQTLNTTIARIDYVPSAKHRIFVRGNLQKDITDAPEQFNAFNSYGASYAAAPPSTTTEDNTKGITAGYTWTITPNIVNDIRYGYIRQGYATSGVGSGDYVDFRGLDTPTSESRSNSASVPVNNIVDNMSITKGAHTLQIGVNWRLIHQNRTSNATSFSSGITNYEWFQSFPNGPEIAGFDPVADAGTYDVNYTNLVGAVSQVTNQYNYALNSPTSGSLLADGAPLSRSFRANEYEGYVQDSWRVKPNLTFIVGLRYTVLQTPWETKGQEVTPTIDTDAFYKKRESEAQQSQIYEPELTFAPAGKFYGKPGFYPKAKNNIAPRLSLVYAPNNKTSIRAGAGMYYDHFGQALVNVFDQNGEFGLSTSVINPSGVLTTTTTPRFIDRNTLPFSNPAPSSTVSYPFTYPQDSFSIQTGIVNKQKTPYNESFDLSIQRQLGYGFTLETNYVGRLGKHLLQSTDLTQPVDFVDPQGGGDYYAAGTQLSKITDANGGSSNVTVQPIPYFENMFPYMANTDYEGESATQAIYSDEWAPQRSFFGATEVLQDIDFGPNCVYYNCPGGVNHQSRFWQDQFSSLYALATIGNSYYHALQVTLHHPAMYGLQFDFNYTWSKSIDYGSDTERNGAGNNSATHIIDTWHPSYNRSPSDFDTRHLLTANFVDQLPFGKGQSLLGTAKPFLNAFIGGWQLSGIFRITSGLPTSFYEAVYDTDYQYGSYAVVTDPLQVKTKRYLDSTGNPEYFTNPSNIDNGAVNGSPVRQGYPGEAGERNNLRGDGYIGLDSGLSKAWKLERFGIVKFSWEVYNVTNTVRFDPEAINTLIYYGGNSFGRSSSELTVPRRMQFALRYDF